MECPESRFSFLPVSFTFPVSFLLKQVGGGAAVRDNESTQHIWSYLIQFGSEQRHLFLTSALEWSASVHCKHIHVRIHTTAAKALGLFYNIKLECVPGHAAYV